MINFLIPITVNSLPAISELEGKQGMFVLPDGSININRQDGTWMVINKQSDHAGILKTTDTVTVQPGVAKWYWAGPGTYTNAGGKIIQKYGIISYTGSQWQALEVELPQARIDTWTAGAYSVGKQVFYDGKIYELNESATAVDVPGVSSKWVKKTGSNALTVFDPIDNINPSTMKATAGRYDAAVTALGDLALVPGDTTIKNYTWADSDQNLFTIAPQAGLLKSDNTFMSYSESGYSFKVWRNVPVLNYDTITLTFTRIGGSLTNPVYVNLIGKKSDGSLTLLIKPDHDPATGTMETVTVDLSDYSSISIMLTTQDSATTKPSMIFLKKGGSLEYNSVIKYVNAKIVGGSGHDYLDLIDFGCKGDGVTDDTDKFNAAIVQIMNAGGGTVFGRVNDFKVSSISIPNMDWQKIEIAGAEMPVFQYGTIGTYDVNKKKKQMQIISDLQNPVRGVINVENGTAYDNFNFVFLSVKNLRVKTYQNPNCHGINALNAVQLNIENVYVDTGVYNVQCVEPTHGTTALVIPHNSNGAFNGLYNFSAQGFDTGIDVYEHTDGIRIFLHSCKHGLVFKGSDHASYFSRVLGQRNTNQVTVEGSHVFEIAQLNCEYVGSGQFDSTNAWQKIQYELNDPNNLGVGSITYANVRGGVGKVPYFRMNGGTGVIVKKVGSETRLSGSGVPDPNPIN